jgi:hypothetical protein
MLRGNAGQDIFTEKSDLSRFLLIIQQEQELSRWRIQWLDLKSGVRLEKHTNFA